MGVNLRDLFPQHPVPAGHQCQQDQHGGDIDPQLLGDEQVQAAGSALLFIENRDLLLFEMGDFTGAAIRLFPGLALSASFGSLGSTGLAPEPEPAAPPAGAPNAGN